MCGSQVDVLRNNLVVLRHQSQRWSGPGGVSIRGWLFSSSPSVLTPHPLDRSHGNVTSVFPSGCKNWKSKTTSYKECNRGWQADPEPEPRYDICQNFYTTTTFGYGYTRTRSFHQITVNHNIFRFASKQRFQSYHYMSHLLWLGKFEYGGGPIFKVVLEC